MSAKFDVVAVELKTSEILWVSGPHDAENADAVIKMAIMRQGIEDRFFGSSQHGQYKAGEKWSSGVPLPELDKDYMVSGGTMYPRGTRGL